MLNKLIKPVSFKEIRINNFNPTNKNKIECRDCGTLLIKPQNKFLTKCSICGSVSEFFSPTPFQKVVIELENRIVLVAGGFGSGKTTADAKKIQKHALTIPYAKIACFAQTEKQLLDIFKDKILDAFFLDEWFVKGKKQKSKWVLINGSEIYFQASDNQQKVRSSSFTMAIIIEASKEKLYGVFEQLKARLRDPSAVVYKLDSNGNPIFEEDEEGNKRQVVDDEFSQLIIETNPTELWPKGKVLLKSKTIYHTSTVLGISDLQQKVRRGEEDVVSIISSTVDNPILTPAFIKSLKADKPEWKIRRDIYGDFSDKNRLIFGDLLNNIIEPFRIPLNWPRYVIADPGIKDKFALLWGAIDPVHRIVYFFDEFYEDEVLISDVVKSIKVQEEKTNTTSQNIFIRLIDPKAGTRSHSRNDYTTVQGIFEEYNLNFELAKKSGDKKADIIAAQSMIAKGNFRVFSSLVNFKWELAQYAWQISKDETQFEEKVPIKNDHLIDCFRYFIMELPQNLQDLDLRQFQQKIYANSRMASIFGNSMNLNNGGNNSNGGNFFKV